MVALRVGRRSARARSKRVGMVVCHRRTARFRRLLGSVAGRPHPRLDPERATGAGSLAQRTRPDRERSAGPHAQTGWGRWRRPVSAVLTCRVVCAGVRADLPRSVRPVVPMRGLLGARAGGGSFFPDPDKQRRMLRVVPRSVVVRECLLLVFGQECDRTSWSLTAP